MKYRTYQKLYRISIDERKEHRFQEIIIQTILAVLFWSLIFFFCFVTFNLNPDQFSFYYCILYLILELLFLFSVTQLYESPQFIVYFLRNVPVTETKIFLFHFAVSGWSFHSITELITIAIYLTVFKATWINIVFLLISIINIKIVRTYFEFLLVLSKSRQKQIPVLAYVFFSLTLCLYIIAQKGNLHRLEWSFSFFVSLFSVFSLFSIGTYRIVIKALLSGDLPSGNFVWFYKLTHFLSKLISFLFQFNCTLRKAISFQLLRMMRSHEYTQKILGIGITYFVFSLISDAVIHRDEAYQTGDLSHILYTAFLVSFLSFSTITLDYQLRYKYQLEHLPIPLRSVRASIDIAHGIFLYTLLTFLFFIQLAIGKLSHHVFLDGYMAFTCFYLLGIGIQPAKLQSNRYREKAPFYFKFIFFSIVIETLFYIHVIWPIKLTVLFLCFVFMYRRSYQKCHLEKEVGSTEDGRTK